MRIEKLSRIALLAVLVAGSALAVRAQQDSSQQPPVDPVAEAAKKARAQQKAEGKPKKVYTNDDFASSSTPAVAPDSSAQGENKDAGAGTDAVKDKDKEKKEDTKGEEYWRKRFATTRDKLASAEKELDILQRELDKNEVQYYPDPQKAMEQQFNRSEINEKRSKIDAKQKEIEALKQQLSDMEDDLRKAGGDPGWAR